VFYDVRIANAIFYGRISTKMLHAIFIVIIIIIDLIIIIVNKKLLLDQVMILYASFPPLFLRAGKGAVNDKSNG
jgi:hypothetical protein